MNISQILNTGTTSTTSSKTTTQAAAAAANPITASINKSTAKLQTQLDTATANLSTLGKFKASVSVVQTSAKSLTTLKDSSSSDEVKKALTAFVNDFNNMVSSTQTAAAGTSGVNTISRGMTRAMTADFSRVSALRPMGSPKPVMATSSIPPSLKRPSRPLPAASKARWPSWASWWTKRLAKSWPMMVASTAR